MLRSVLSVLGGFAAISVLVMVSTFVLARMMLGTRSQKEMMEAKPTLPFTWASLVSSGVIAAIGGVLTAIIAARAPLNHVWALAGLMAFMGVFSLFQTKGSNAPRWYNLALIVVCPACTMLGGYLHSL